MPRKNGTNVKMPSRLLLEERRMRWSFFAGIIVTILILALTAFAGVTSGLIPVNGDSPPSTLEHWAARTALIAGVERRMGRGKNPSSGSQAVLDGIRVYRNQCEVCHGGVKGSHESAIALGLYQRPPSSAARKREWKISRTLTHHG